MSASAQTVATATRGLSLRTKWTFAMLALAVLPLLAVGPVVSSLQRKGLLHAEEAHQSSVMDHAGSMLESQLQSAGRTIGAMVNVLAEARMTDPDAKVALLRALLSRCEELDAVTIYGPDGSKLDTVIRGEGAEAAAPASIAREHRDYDERGQWLAPSATRDRGLELQFVQPIVVGGQRTGWVLGQVRRGVVPEILRSLSRDHFEGRDDGLVLVGRELEVLATSRAVEDVNLRVGTSMVGRDIFRVILFPPERLSVLYLSSAEFTQPDGSAWVGSVRTIPALKVAVFARRPAEQVFTSLAATRRAVSIEIVAIGIIATLVATWIASRTTRPIGELMKLAREFAARKFTARSTVKTGDELEGLGSSMEVMADDLSASEKEIARRAGVEKDLSRFLPATVAAEIAEGRRKLELGGERRAVSVLFADVVSFTPFAERADPEKVVEFLNELFTVLTEVVFRHEGTVDKFVGDAIMAFFGAPNAMDDHGERAVACAEDMHRFVDASAPEWKQKYGIDVKIAVGVNSGEVIVGNLGSESRMDYTAIGDVVNVAARLEALARPGQTLLTSEAAGAAGDAFEFRPLGEHPLRGKEQLVAIVELVR